MCCRRHHAEYFAMSPTYSGLQIARIRNLLALNLTARSLLYDMS